MIRTRLPGGVCTPRQWLALDEIAQRYANGTLRITTRQAFQFHGVIKTELKTTMAAINATLIDTHRRLRRRQPQRAREPEPGRVARARGGA